MAGLLLVSNSLETRTVELGVLACRAGTSASATVLEMAGMALKTRELVAVKADKSLAASFSAAVRGNPPPDGTSVAMSDFVCEALFPEEDSGPEKSLC